VAVWLNSLSGRRVLLYSSLPDFSSGKDDGKGIFEPCFQVLRPEKLHGSIPTSSSIQ